MSAATKPDAVSLDFRVADLALAEGGTILLRDTSSCPVSLHPEVRTFARVCRWWPLCFTGLEEKGAVTGLLVPVPWRVC